MKAIILSLILCSLPVLATPKKNCGQHGSIKKRIQDCASQPDSSKENFVLVSRSNESKEVWLDVHTNLLWSDKLSSYITLEERASTEDRCAREGVKELADISILRWRLPTISEFKLADRHDIRLQLPSMENIFWTSTTVQRRYECYGNWYGPVCDTFTHAKVFNGGTGHVVDSRDFYHDYHDISVRCVAEVH